MPGLVPYYLHDFPVMTAGDVFEMAGVFLEEDLRRLAEGLSVRAPQWYKTMGSDCLLSRGVVCVYRMSFSDGCSCR